MDPALTVLCGADPGLALNLAQLGNSTSLLQLDISGTGITTSYIPPYVEVTNASTHRPNLQNFTCYDVVPSPSTSLSYFGCDDQLFGYAHCFCDSGFFGHPPMVSCASSPVPRSTPVVVVAVRS